MSHRAELDVFTIRLPGEEAGLDAQTALLIGGSQGFPRTAALIRQASKTIGEICPAAMLVLAVQALAKRLGAEAILGVSAGEQTSLRDHRSRRSRDTMPCGR